MGFTYCISVNLGPFRVNLSKFSLGYSVGGRGFCVGTTAREKKYCLTRSRRALPIGCLAAGYQVWPPSRPAARFQLQHPLVGSWLSQIRCWLSCPHSWHTRRDRH
ncbi:MAG: hypothetical protein CAK90_07620 [Spartobacteria bacterium AMD-G4]|nr:MAG: hypothetical protein CAK90_07620 [Spartobacteria bacterium AMD-G4]